MFPYGNENRCAERALANAEELCSIDFIGRSGLQSYVFKITAIFFDKILRNSVK